MECNICGSAAFDDMHARKNVRCKDCGSLERTRLFWLYLESAGITSDSRILHLAPEAGVYKILNARLRDGNYITADIDPARYAFAAGCTKLDLCELEDQPAYEFDFIIHSHVLEHVPCNIAYTLFHLHRMMKKDGLHICIIPFMPGRYDESFQEIGSEERIRRFGQFDHVRRFGSDDKELHLGKLITLPKNFDARDRFSEEQLRAANIPESHWCGFHIGTVLTLKRSDMKFLA
jgi:hypothetical protein